ncbi:branched-chain amino acid transport system permease protein [Paracoccus aminovorans]|uniref:Branched-chain amino acid transport system permease protein n=1 Tax=Paracoccus aminovorans TaxID=34004 RepID=A0A1I3B3R1_9RHOB|nr:branched-chain amino acid ABC transporter permease [Paracoccus aminovorans]CQR87568.1 ABC-type branched-chain amino acid transport system, permease component [Paracoccus aminovorans]SFH56852.1 branched-chain amino acid transport system permease protein [Paracoccus aminovorans]
MRERNPATGMIVTALVAAGIGPLVAAVAGDAYLLSIFERFLIFAVAASSLNLILGYGGMVSFGHAVYLGIGAYATGLMANAGLTGLWMQVPAVVLASGLAAALIGVIALRTSGVHFIMITLALAQILYYLAQSSSVFGGDDGMVIYGRSTLWPGYDAFDPWQFYAFVAVLALVLLWLIDWVIRSDFGSRLVAVRENAQRANALGFDTLATRLLAFVIAGAVCGIAGLLLANQSEFASPGYANWQRSGELLAIVILGGVGTRFGPVYGALAFVVVEHVLAAITSHWAIVFGPMLILVVLFYHASLSGLGAQLGRKLGLVRASQEGM